MNQLIATAASTLPDSDTWNPERPASEGDSPTPWDNPNPLMDVDQFANYLSLKPDFVRQLIKEERITKIKIGRKVMLEKSEADRLIAIGRRPATRPLNTDRFGH